MKSLLEISKDIAGKPYKLGESDCFMLILDYLKLNDIKINDDIQYKNLTLKNYKDVYLKNPSILNIAIEFFMKFCHEINLAEAMAGDILVLENDSGTKFFGIDGGNGKVITAVIGRSIEVLNRCKRLRALRIG